MAYQQIYINPQHRFPGYEQQSYFHPLFLYEGVLLLFFGVLVWWKVKKIGNGKLFLGYLLYYISIRFCLDFLRIDKTYFAQTNFGLNQTILLAGFMFVCALWSKNAHRK
jgi:prolipoprotein diacylglyceryltransferase